DYPLGMDQTWNATQLALADLGMPIVSGQRDHDSATIETRTGAGDNVTISLTPNAVKVPADGASTRISVRVGMFGDGPVSERVLNQIDSRLSLTRTPVQPAPVASTPYQAGAPQNSAGQLVPVVTAPPTYQTGPPPLAGGQ
ncbi:MAG TPA: DUF3568 family protein, partial [Gemmataceae bacterium]|nr:DUF3568 family protein [Gemmataceae bacterium]